MYLSSGKGIFKDQRTSKRYWNLNCYFLRKQIRVKQSYRILSLKHLPPFYKSNLNGQKRKACILLELIYLK